MKNLNEVVADNLVYLRKSKKLTQQELATQVGFSDKSVSKWELGKAIPSVEVLKDLASYYGVTVDYLISEHSETDRRIARNQNRSSKKNQITIIAMAVTFIWFTAACVYAANILNGNQSNTGINLWIAFVWAIPLSFFVCCVLSRYFWGKCIPFVIFESAFIWTIILAFFIQFLCYPPYQNLAFIFFVCIPLQVGIILIANLKNEK